jgi:ribosomal protein S18 acetylase RimI-like enzyme
MGFMFRGLWHLTLFLTLLGVLGGAALISAFAHAAGPALGQGAYGTKTFVGGVSDDDSRADLSDIAGHYLEPGGNFWVARDGDRVVGFVGLQRVSRGTGKVKRLAVDPDYQRRGVATRLVARLMGYARAAASADCHPLREVVLSTGDNEHGRSIYERFGFEVVGFDERCGDHLMRAADLRAGVLAGVR